MPVLILWKLAGMAALGAAGYAAKKWADGGLSTSDDFPSDDEWDRAEARELEHRRESLARYAPTLLAENRIEHSPEECERLAELAVDPDHWTAFEAMVDELAERSRDVRELDARIEAAVQELAELKALSTELEGMTRAKS